MPKFAVRANGTITILPKSRDGMRPMGRNRVIVNIDDIEMCD